MKIYFKISLLILLVPFEASAEKLSNSLSSGFTRSPTLAFENLTYAFFGEDSDTSFISPLTNTTTPDVSAEAINYNFVIPPVRLEYGLTKLLEYVDKNSLFFEYSRVKFPDGIGVFTEPGTMSSITAGLEVSKDLMEISDIGALGIAGSVSQSLSSFQSNLLDVNANSLDTSIYLYSNVKPDSFKNQFSIEARVHALGDFELLLNYDL